MFYPKWIITYSFVKFGAAGSSLLGSLAVAQTAPSEDQRVATDNGIVGHEATSVRCGTLTLPRPKPHSARYEDPALLTSESHTSIVKVAAET